MMKTTSEVQSGDRAILRDGNGDLRIGTIVDKGGFDFVSADMAYVKPCWVREYVPSLRAWACQEL